MAAPPREPSELLRKFQALRVNRGDAPAQSASQHPASTQAARDSAEAHSAMRAPNGTVPARDENVAPTSIQTEELSPKGSDAESDLIDAFFQAKNRYPRQKGIKNNYAFPQTDEEWLANGRGEARGPKSADLSDGVKSHAQDMETSDDGGQSDEDWPTQGGTDDDVLVEIKDILCDEITYTTGYFTALGTFFDVKFEQCIRENVIFKDCQMLGVHFIDCSIYDVTWTDCSLSGVTFRDVEFRNSFWRNGCVEGRDLDEASWNEIKDLKNKEKPAELHELKFVREQQAEFARIAKRARKVIPSTTKTEESSTAPAAVGPSSATSEKSDCPPEPADTYSSAPCDKDEQMAMDKAYAKQLAADEHMARGAGWSSGVTVSSSYASSESTGDVGRRPNILRKPMPGDRYIERRDWNSERTHLEVVDRIFHEDETITRVEDGEEQEEPRDHDVDEAKLEEYRTVQFVPAEQSEVTDESGDLVRRDSGDEDEETEDGGCPLPLE